MADNTSAGMSSDVNHNYMAWFTNTSHATDDPVNVPIRYRPCAQDMDGLRPRVELPRQRSNNLGKALGDQDLSYFGFEPYHCRSPPHQPAPTEGETERSSTSGDVKAYPISPPNSAVVAPSNSWPSEYNLAYLPNILTDIDPASARSHYGQVTPPDDDSPRPIEREASQLQPEVTKRRKRVAVRPRKNTARSMATNSQVADPNDPRCHKRSKFLERNRLAASKCRQKKKSWVGNLETKARELLAHNNALDMEITSLRCEVVHMKLEIAKHRNCDDSGIQDIMKQDAEYFAEAVQTLEQFEKEDNLDISERRPPSNGTEATSRHYYSDTEDTLIRDRSSPSPLVSDDMFATLLRSDFVEDVSNEGEAAASSDWG